MATPKTGNSNPPKCCDHVILNAMKKVLNILAVSLLSLLSQGFGQVYLGRYKRGLLFIALALLNYTLHLFLPPLSYGLNEASFKYVHWGVIVLLVSFALFVLFDAVRIYIQNPHQDFKAKGLPKNNHLRFICLLVLAVFWSLGTTLILPTKSVYTYVIPTDSMSPTLEAGDQIVTVEIAGTFLSDMRNFVVSYSFAPKENEENDSYKIHVGRIAAVEGDKIRIDTKTADFFVNGNPLPLLSRGDRSFDELKELFFPAETQSEFLQKLWSGQEVEIPEGHVFILRDNYSNAVDSRTEGPLEASRIGEKVVFIYFSKNDSGVQWKRLNKDVK